MSRSDLYTGVNKQGFIETLIRAKKNLSQKSKKDEPESQESWVSVSVSRAAAERLWGLGQVTCSLWTSASSPLK